VTRGGGGRGCDILLPPPHLVPSPGDTAWPFALWHMLLHVLTRVCDTLPSRVCTPALVTLQACIRHTRACAHADMPASCMDTSASCMDTSASCTLTLGHVHRRPCYHTLAPRTHTHVHVHEHSCYMREPCTHMLGHTC